MLTNGAEGFDSLLLPLTIAATLMALLRAALIVCARATEARDERAIARNAENADGRVRAHEKRTR